MEFFFRSRDLVDFGNRYYICGLALVAMDTPNKTLSKRLANQFLCIHSKSSVEIRVKWCAIKCKGPMRCKLHLDTGRRRYFCPYCCCVLLLLQVGIATWERPGRGIYVKVAASKKGCRPIVFSIAVTLWCWKGLPTKSARSESRYFFLIGNIVCGILSGWWIQ